MRAWRKDGVVCRLAAVQTSVRETMLVVCFSAFANVSLYLAYVKKKYVRKMQIVVRLSDARKGVVLHPF